MDRDKLLQTREKYKLPYHWIRDPLHRDSLPYFGYARIIVEELPQKPCRVLDAGCGDGRISHEMVQAGHQVTGVDLLETSAQYARIMVPHANFTAADLRQDLQETCGLEPEYFDAVVLVEVYEHIPPQDCPLVLENLKALLRSQGTLIVSVPTEALPPSNLHYRHFGPGQCEDELAQAGFVVDKVVGQHDLSLLGKWLFSQGLDRLLNNGLLEPVILTRLRRKLFMRFCNRTDPSGPCGRYILIAHKA